MVELVILLFVVLAVAAIRLSVRRTRVRTNGSGNRKESVMPCRSERSGLIERAILARSMGAGR